MSLFNYEAALAAVKDNAFAAQFLELNKARMVELGTEAGMSTLTEVLALFAAQKNKEAWDLYYGTAANGGTATWKDLAAGIAQDVTDSAAMAQRAKDLRDWLVSCSTMALKALLAILVAGFCA